MNEGGLLLGFFNFSPSLVDSRSYFSEETPGRSVSKVKKPALKGFQGHLERVLTIMTSRTGYAVLFFPLLICFSIVAKAKGGEQMWLEGREGLDRIQELVSLQKSNRVQKVDMPVEVAGQVWKTIERDQKLISRNYKITGVVYLKRFSETLVMLDSEDFEDVEIGMLFDAKTYKFKYLIKLGGA